MNSTSDRRQELGCVHLYKMGLAAVVVMLGCQPAPWSTLRCVAAVIASIGTFVCLLRLTSSLVRRSHSAPEEHPLHKYIALIDLVTSLTVTIAACILFAKFFPA